MINKFLKIFSIDPSLWKANAGRVAFGTTENKAEQSAAYSTNVWVKRCGKLLGNAMVRMEWGIKQNGRLLPDNHPIVQAVRDVNDEDNWPDTLRGSVLDMKIFGKAFWKVNEVAGIFINYQRLNARWTELDWDRATGKLTGVRFKNTFIPIDEIIYFKDYDPDSDIDGQGDVQTIVQKAKIEKNQDNHIETAHANYGIPPVILSSDQVVRQPDMDRYMTWWKAATTGLRNFYKVVMVGSGLKPITLASRIRDFTIPIIAKDNRRAISVAMGVPPGLSGAIETGNRATREQDKVSMFEDTTEPLALYMAGILNAENGLMARMGDGLTFAWRLDLLLNLPSRRFMEGQRAEGLVEAGIITTQEARDQLQMDIKSEMHQWARKSANKIKEGRSADVKFNNRYIPNGEYIRIKGELIFAETLDDVKEIFA